jgi:hypothetical protein
MVMVKEDQLITIRVATISKKLFLQITPLTLKDWDKGIADTWINDGAVLGWVMHNGYKHILRVLDGEYRVDGLSHVPDCIRQIYLV